MKVRTRVTSWRATAAVAVWVASSQVQWFLLRTAVTGGWWSGSVKRVLAVVSIPLLAVCGRVARTFPVPGPPRPDYRWFDRAGVLGVVMYVHVLASPLVVVLAGWIFSVPDRDRPSRDAPGWELLVDGVVVAALWEELLWRVVVLGLLLRVMGPRAAVIVQAVAFAVAHTSLSVGLGRVPHDVSGQYLLDLAAGVAVAGVLYGVLVVELGTVWPAVVAHAVWNLAVSSPVGVGIGLHWLLLVAMVPLLRRRRRQQWQRLLAWFGPTSPSRPLAPPRRRTPSV